MSSDLTLYQSNLLTPCGAEALDDMELNEYVGDLSGKICDPLES
jgi:hypothetical protein